MKRYLFPLLAGFAVASLLYIFGFTTALNYSGYGILLFGMALSGNLVSGDRMRANAQYESSLPKNFYLQVIVFSLPFLLLNYLA
ncbi:hypothetical protein JZO70_14130 [Enterococcus sp. 669A]|uniref:Uncharacterized protein n=1 Tax=Candidatus Enterococcus moelleringii TaxID=2815325 RepID=A0ABS3LCF3_9ENTE|nr:hypothetical protein [Enterococcus sp. 669A]MBO1307312.1 hypothetical protein [Enterococcus sp. 669A]